MPRERQAASRFVHISCADVTLLRRAALVLDRVDAPQRPFGDLARTKLQAEELVRVSGQRASGPSRSDPVSSGVPATRCTFANGKHEAESGGIRIVGAARS